MNKIIINGKTINVQGNNISVIKDKIYVNGTVIEEGLNGIVTIQFQGDLSSLKCGGNVEVTGNVNGRIDCGGNIRCGNVDGNVDAGGNVTCGKVDGRVDAGGSVTVKNY